MVVPILFSRLFLFADLSYHVLNEQLQFVGVIAHVGIGQLLEVAEFLELRVIPDVSFPLLVQMVHEQPAVEFIHLVQLELGA